MALGTPVAAATTYSGTIGSAGISPAYPAGILATDVVLVFVGQRPNTANGGTATTPTGWTLREELLAAGGYGTTLTTDAGNTNLRVYSWDAPVAGQTGLLTIPIANNNVTWAFMVRIPTGGGALSYGSAEGQQTTAPGTSMSIALTNGASATAFQTGDVAIWAMCIPTDISTPGQFSAEAITATGATFATAVELNEPDSSLQFDIGGYSAWSNVTAGSSSTAPTVTVTVGGTRTNVRGPVVLVRVRETALPATQNLTPGLYTNTNTFHNPVASAGAVTLTASPVENTSVFYAATVDQTGGGTQTLTPGLYSNSQTFYAPTVAPGTVTLTATRVDGAQTFYAPTVAAGPVTLSPVRYDSAQVFYSPTVAGAAVNLTATRYDNANAFYGATVAPGAVTLSPIRFDNPQSFLSPTVTRGTVTLSPVRYDNSSTIFAPTVAPGAATLTPARLDNAQTFYSASIATGPVSLAPARYDSSQTFYSPTVTPGAVTLTPTRYDNAQTFYSPTAAIGAVILTPPLVTNSQTFYGPSIATGPANLTAALFSNSNSFYAPTVSTGAVSLTPARVDNAQSFYSATISLGASLLLPSRLDNANTFYGPALGLNITFPGYVAPGYVSPGYVLPPVANDSVFFAPTVTTGTVVLFPTRYDNAQTFYGGSINGLVETSEATGRFILNVGTMMRR